MNRANRMGRGTAVAAALMLAPCLARADLPPAAPETPATAETPAAPAASPSPVSSVSPSPSERARASERAWMLSAPLARDAGLQMALGLSVRGSSRGVFGSQGALLGELGVKTSASVLLGAYAGIAVGGVGSDLAATCPTGAACSGFSTNVRFGAQFQRHFLPGERFNPWIGIGLGYALSNASLTRPGLLGASAQSSGPELRLAFGIDVRINGSFAVGPVLDGGYETVVAGEVRDGGGGARELPKEGGTWSTLGVRFVVFP